MENYVEELAKKASEAALPHDAQLFSQAACNVANALRVIRELQKDGW